MAILECTEIGQVGKKVEAIGELLFNIYINQIILCIGCHIGF